MLMVILTVISMVLPNEEPKLGKFRVNHEQLEWTHDKEAHAIGGFGLYYFCRYKELSSKDAILIVSSLGIVKESIDALVPWEIYGNWGGDGWSNADLLANTIGLSSAYIIDKLWEKKGHENNTISFKIYPGHIWLNIHFN